jgi:hypothetical protein
VLAVVCIALVQLLTNPVKELLELSQGGIGGIDIHPVFDHLFTELTLDVLSALQLGYWDIIKSLRADTSQVTNTLLPRLGGDEGIELVSPLNNGDPASVGEAAKVSTKLKQTILHLILCLCYELSLGSFGSFPAHQAVSPSVTVRTLLLQEVVDAG